jgi:hypothetical protein
LPGWSHSRQLKKTGSVFSNTPAVGGVVVSSPASVIRLGRRDRDAADAVVLTATYETQVSAVDATAAGVAVLVVLPRLALAEVLATTPCGARGAVGVADGSEPYLASASAFTSVKAGSELVPT